MFNKKRITIMRKFLICTLCVLSVLFTACSEKSNHEKALQHLNELSTELMTCTTQEKYDVVYEKVVAIKNDPMFSALAGETNEQKLEIVAEAAALIQEALAVKAILFAMPKTIEPTEKDIKALVKNCIDRKLNIMVPPYSEIASMIREYYKL